ncbi:MULTISPECIES: DUF2946 domain-containing protein [Noviherbaspirillum]|uniref:DUF2946 domain-containing protein n=1 Tax=Noviherbaspirillum TaxID=1344552 RepID=UPI00124F7242
MRTTRYTRLLTAWMALLAILLVALAPSISHAFAAKSPSSPKTVEICTASGVKQVSVPYEGTLKPFSTVKHDQHFEDCPFCRIHSDTPGPVPATVSAILNTVASFPRPFLFYQAPRPLFTWAPAQSRAPPTHS